MSAVTKGSDAGRTRPSSKRAEQVALRIEADIMAAGWPLGKVLGSEGELQERYGVSRAVLREAIRLVEHHEAAVMRRGPSGGLIVTAPDPRSATGAALIYLEWIGATLDDLLEARLMIEPLAADLAAENLTEEGIERLREVAAGSADYRNPDTVKTDPHVVIAEASGNTVLSVFVEILVLLTRRYAAAAPGLAGLSQESLDRGRAAHRELGEAVVAGDAPRARTLMTEHLSWLRQETASLPETEQQLRHLSPPGPHRSSPNRRVKMAEDVAYQIRRRILDENLPPGHWLGSEAEMVERYGVSRAVLREAVRILEWHSVVAMQRGPGGGMKVRVPAADAGVDAIALYLDYRKAGLDDLTLLRSAIELGCVEKVCERYQEPEVRSRLEAALTVGLDTPRADLNVLSNHVHIELCDLAGNPVLAMFSRILTALWARFNATPRAKDDVSDEQVVRDVTQTHRLITDAVLAGDKALARHRMSRHLSALSDWWH
jgi:DNA-binding FadR family transcriptional regulator